MQSTRIYLAIGLLVVAVANSALAEELQHDPAWQQGKLDNGFSWQVLATPQRPSDRIELRLVVQTGSLVESSQETGFAHLLPYLALTHSKNLSAPQLESLWQQAINNDRPLPPAIVSYDYTVYNLSIPNNRPGVLKDAMTWLADTAGHMQIDETTLQTALSYSHKEAIGTFPPNPRDAWWRYRLKGSALLAHDPSQTVNPPVDLKQLQSFYRQWYTPDAMTLYVVGKVDSRSLDEMINATFSALEGKRETPSALPVLSPLTPQAVSLMSDQVNKQLLSLVWDTPWQPIRDSQALNHYWRSDLAREALFLHIQRVLEKSEQKKLLNIDFECRVQYQNAQCAIHLDTTKENLNSALIFIAQEMAKVRNSGLSQENFALLLNQKTMQLDKLFATYARTDTDLLMNQRLRSQQSGVVDIAPEQYQKLRHTFLTTLTLPELNQELKQQLSQPSSLVLMQPAGEPEADMKSLQRSYDKVMAPVPSPAVNSSASLAGE